MMLNNLLLIPSSPYYYSKAIGVKTGYTSEGGYNLVAAAKHEERTLIAVLIGCGKQNRFKIAINLFEEAFKKSL